MAVKKNATEAAEMEGKEKTVNNTMKDGKTDSGANNEATEGEKKERETVTLSYWSHVDRKLTRRLIDAILQGINDWLAALTADEKIVGGRVELREEENSLTALMSGKAKFHIYITPPSPLRLMEYVLEYDISYLSSLLAV